MIFKFGSFNLKNISRASVAHTGITKRDFSKIAEIIRQERLDVVAFQEILSEGYALNYLVKNYLPGWDIRWKEPHASSDPSKAKDNRGEGYAFIWNTHRLALASSSSHDGTQIYEPRIISDALRFDSRMFARTPMYARFIPVNGGFFEFRLINVHLHFGDNSKTEIVKRKEEYNYLIEKIYPSISKERRYGNNREAYTIIMGDYNLNLYIPRGNAENRINKNTYIDSARVVENQTITTIQDQLTTLKSESDGIDDDNPNRGYSQNYDHFSFDVNTFDMDDIKYTCKRIDAVRDYCNDDFERYRSEISDHIPISLELFMNEL